MGFFGLSSPKANPILRRLTLGVFTGLLFSEAI